jgi:hypothetical protein
VVGCLHFIDVGKYAAVPDNVVGKIRTVLYYRLIAYVAGNNRAVPNPRMHAKVVVFEQNFWEGA